MSLNSAKWACQEQRTLVLALLVLQGHPESSQMNAYRLVASDRMLIRLFMRNKAGGYMPHNNTIETQLNHKSIRKFKDQALSAEIIDTLVDVAQQTSTSSFMQAYSIISVTDQDKKEALARIGMQPYIAGPSHLFVFVVDHYRNDCIAKAQGIESDVTDRFDRFMSGMSDALIAAQNMLIAAESIGLGGLYLGSILNQVDEVVELLNLPHHVAPAVGLLVGYPDQAPQLKPRLPRHLIHFENSYPAYDDILEQLKDYDEVVSKYYDLRNANRRVDKFSIQIANGMQREHPGRAKMLEYYRKQGLAKQ